MTNTPDSGSGKNPFIVGANGEVSAHGNFTDSLGEPCEFKVEDGVLTIKNPRLSEFWGEPGPLDIQSVLGILNEGLDVSTVRVQQSEGRALLLGSPMKMEEYDEPTLVIQEPRKSVLQQVRAATIGEPPRIEKEYYRKDLGGFVHHDTLLPHVLDEVGPLHPDDVEQTLVNLTVPAEAARDMIKRLERTSDADMSATRYAKIMDRFHVDTVISSLGHITFGKADVLVSAVSFAHFVLHGARAGVTFKDYLRAFAYQLGDAAIGVAFSCAPGIKQIADEYVRASEASVTAAFPDAMVRAIEAAKTVGLSDEDIKAAVEPSQVKKESWVKETEKIAVKVDKVKKALVLTDKEKKAH